jgi:polyhydroxyalkanoate synthesis regulator phasin
MEDLFKKTISFGIGLFDYTKEKVETLVEEMVKRGEVSQQDGPQAVEELWEKAAKEQSAFWNKVKTYINSIVDEMPLVRRSELKALEERLAALEKRLGDRPA